MRVESATAWRPWAVAGLLFVAGSGCVVGNIMSGWALPSVGMFLFGAATLLADWIVTHFYLMGGGLRDLPWALSRSGNSRRGGVS